jgi:hypothetical protein
MLNEAVRLLILDFVKLAIYQIGKSSQHKT